MSDELTSKKILTEYLDKGLYHLISKKQLHLLLNKAAHRSVDEETVAEIYALLSDTKDQTINQHVRDDIENAKIVSIFDEKDKEETVNDDELSKLVGSMLLLDQSLEEKISKAEDECDTILDDIKETTKKLRKIKYPTHDKKSLDRLENVLGSIQDDLLEQRPN